MPAYTSPDNIQYPVSTDQVAPLETVFANVAQSTQNALAGFRTGIYVNRALQTFRWANAAARTAQTGMAAGDIGYQQNTRVYYQYNGTAWQVRYGNTFAVANGSNVPVGAAAWTFIPATYYATPMVNDGFTFSGGILTIPDTGIYRVSATLYYASPGNPLAFQLTVNSTNVDTAATKVRDYSAGSTTNVLDGSQILSLNSGDLLRLYAFSATAATIGSLQLTAERIR